MIGGLRLLDAADFEALGDLRGARPVSRAVYVSSRDLARNALKIMRPLTASSDGGESRRWRMISERPRDAAIRRDVPPLTPIHTAPPDRANYQQQPSGTGSTTYFDMV